MFSFDTRKKVLELQSYVRRISDLTVSGIVPTDSEERSDRRQIRILPSLLTPWRDDAPVVTESARALTRDLSDNGVGLVLHQAFHADQVVLTVRLPNEDRPWFFLGEIRQNNPIGAGY